MTLPKQRQTELQATLTELRDLLRAYLRDEAGWRELARHITATRPRADRQLLRLEDAIVWEAISYLWDTPFEVHLAGDGEQTRVTLCCAGLPVATGVARARRVLAIADAIDGALTWLVTQGQS